MSLIELKALLGIAEGDTSQDVVLQIYLDAALAEAQRFANAYDWTSTDPLPSGLKLGIARWVELSRKRSAGPEVASQSMAGMSQTFVTANQNDYYKEVFDFWGPYRKKGLVFHTAKRKDAKSINYGLIPDDITITGTKKL